MNNNDNYQKWLNRPDNVYYDVLVPYVSGSSNIAVYTKDFPQAIIDKCSDYYLSFDRFNIPTSLIPLQIYDSVLYKHSVELIYNGISSGEIPFRYIPLNNNIPQTLEEYYYMDTYDVVILMLNNALKEAFTTLAGLVVLPAGAVAPFFVLDHDTQVLSYYAQKSFYETQPGPSPYPPPPYPVSPVTNPIYVYTNLYTYSLLEGFIVRKFNNPVPSYRAVQFLAFDQFNNTISRTIGGTPYDFYVMKTCYKSLPLIEWNVCKGILFTTDRMNCLPEYLPNIGDSNVLNARKILANFDIIYTANETSSLRVQYILQSQYKLIDLVNDGPLTNIDIKIYWYDAFNRLHPVYLRENQALSMRFIFIKKNPNYKYNI